MQISLPNRIKDVCTKAVMQETEKRVKIFVAGLGSQLAEAEFKAHFAVCGEIVFCQLFIDRLTGEPKGQGKIEYASHSSAREAIRRFNNAEVCGRRVVVTEWREAHDGRRMLGPSVYIAQMHPKTTSRDLREMAEAAGCIMVDVSISKHKETLQPCRMGKIELVDEDSAKACMQQLDGAVLDGNKLRVREFCAAGPPGHKARGPSAFVAGLSSSLTVARLMEAFSGCGEVVSVGIFPERNSGRPRGTGKVEFKTEAALKLALDLSGSVINGQSIAVREFGTPFHLQRGRSCPSQGYTVFAAGLSPGMTPEMLKERSSRASGGVAKVSFATPEAQRKAVEERHLSELDNRLLIVKDFGGDTVPACPSVFISGCSLFSSPPSQQSRQIARRTDSATASCADEQPGNAWPLKGVQHPSATASARSTSAGSAHAHDGSCAGLAETTEECLRNAGVSSGGVPTTERRIDPDDGETYTLAELTAKYESLGLCEEEVVREYWEFDCHPLAALAVAEGTMASVEAARPRSGARGTGNCKRHPLRMSLKDWVEAIDQQWLRHMPEPPAELPGVRELLGLLEEQFDDLNQIMQLYVKKGPDHKSVLADDFFEDLGIQKIGHRRMIKKWIEQNT